MARSHVCSGCGKDLVRVASVEDPRLGAVVVCPDCGLAVVRLRNTESARRRQRLAWRLLGMQCAAAALFVGCYSGIAGALAEFVTRSRVTIASLWARPENYLYDAQWTLIGGGLVTLAAGVWLGSAFRHLRAPTVLAGFTLVIVVLTMWDPALRAVHGALMSLMGGGQSPRGPADASVELGAALLMLVPTMIGMGAARSVARAARPLRSARFRARLTKARRRKHSA